MSKQVALSVSLLAIALRFGAAMAEGRCPPGMYPIDGIGVSACAPIPGYARAPEPLPPEPEPEPEPGWLLTWGAVVLDSERGTVGQASGFPSERAALAVAMQDCAAIGGVRCEKLMTYQNQCVAIAVPAVDGQALAGTVVTSRASTVESARTEAEGKCRQQENRECKAVYSACSAPLRLP